MSFALWSLRNPIPVILLFFALIIAGIKGFINLPVQMFPDMDLPIVTVDVLLPNSNPNQIETQAIIPIEDEIAKIDQIRHLQTFISNGRGIIIAEFYLGKSTSTAMIEIKQAIDRIRSTLPPELIEPDVEAVHVGGAPIVTFAITSNTMSETDLAWFVDDKIAKAFRGIKGLGNFERLGGTDREVQIEIDPARLAYYGLTLSDVSTALKNTHVDGVAGQSKIGAAEQSLRVTGTVHNIDELRGWPIIAPGHQILRLDQIASILDTHTERNKIALLDGQKVIGFSVYKVQGQDDIKLLHIAEDLAETLNAQYPDVHIEAIYNTTEQAQAKFQGSMSMLYEGMILAIIVVWLFLKDWRATLIAAIALPLSILPAYAFMSWMGYSLNTLTLLAQCIVIGILVDDAIVEIENITAHVQNGVSVRRATKKAVSEIARAVIATSLAIIVIFLPTSFMDGISGRFFRQFGWTVVVCVFMSLVVSRLLTPILATYFLRLDHAQENTKQSALVSSYMSLLRWSLGHRSSVVLMAVGLFVASLLLTTFLPKGFLPAADSGITTISLELPPGSSIDTTVEKAEIARRQISSIPGIKEVMTVVGTSMSMDGMEPMQIASNNKADMVIVLNNSISRPPQREIEAMIHAKLETIPGVHSSLKSAGIGGKLSVLFSGDDYAALRTATTKIVNEMHEQKIAENAMTNAAFEKSEFTIRPLWARVAENGITTQTLADTIRIATSGDYDANLPRIDLGNRRIFMRPTLPASTKDNLDAIKQLRVEGSNGLIPLETVTDITSSTAPVEINRYDRHRYIAVNAELNGAPLGDTLDQLKQLPTYKGLPSSVKTIETGDAETMVELFGNFTLAAIIGILGLYAMLTILFKSFCSPLTILSILPLSFGGGLLALFITHSEINLSSLIGIIMLLGIVAKNSILLVDNIIVNTHEHNHSTTEAIMESCKKRARPIIMTSAAMIAGMVPVALGIGHDPEFRRPLAITAIGGIAVSTALSLFVIPVIHAYVEETKGKLKKKYLPDPPPA